MFFFFFSVSHIHSAITVPRDMIGSLQSASMCAGAGFKHVGHNNLLGRFPTLPQGLVDCGYHLSTNLRGADREHTRHGSLPAPRPNLDQTMTARQPLQI